MKLEWDFSELTDFGDNLLGFGSAFNPHINNAIRRLAKALLRWMKEFTPTDSYELIRGWDNNNFAVRGTDAGFEVLIVNKTPYATSVNDGHRSFNQFNVGTDQPYEVKHRRKVFTPYRWQLGDGTHWVYGHFFVERGILRLKSTTEIEQIIFDELQKWWDSL